MQRGRTTIWARINNMLDEGAPSELQGELSKLKQIYQGSMFQSIQKLWQKPDRKEVIDLLLGWGSANYKFSLIRYCFTMRSAELNDIAQQAALKEDEEDQEDQEEQDAPEEGEGQQENEDMFKLQPDALAERILQLDPLVVVEVWNQPPDKGMNLLHFAVRHNSETLLHTILDIFKNGPLKNPETLLVTSGEDVHDSPLIMIIKDEKLRMLQTILQTLPNLTIDESTLKLAIRLKRNDMLLAFAEFRPDCVIVDLVKYCITSSLSEILDVILRERKDIFFNRRLLDYAVRDGNEKIVEILLCKFPNLAVENDGGNPPLHSLQQDDVKAQLDERKRERIRSIVLPYIIRGANGLSPTNGSGRVSPIDQIRALLADPEGRRKEIGLDLGGFRHSSRSIQPFLKMIEGLSSETKSTKQKTAPLLTVEFETDLRYVDIPIPAFPISDIETKCAPERLEATHVLEWLRGGKGVTGIYELRVRDSLYLPHTEEAIGNCLDGFNVEVLDWMRADISIKPLIGNCRNLKRLTLYVSNWANLSYWISGDGYEEMSTFELLRDVEIFILADLIGSSYSSKYEQECQKREKNSRDKLAGRTPPVRIKFNMKFSLRSWSSLITRHEEVAIAKKSTAVEVTHLGAYIEAYSLLQIECQDLDFLEENNAIFPNTTEGQGNLSRIVNVAVIDTGVDPDSIQCHEISGASFVSSESGESPWWFSYHPHGTQMAKVITELNPHCRLLVAKVGDSVMDMTVDRMIQAIRWAVKSKADIISVSAAFFKSNTHLQIAIRDAIQADIVVIASTAGEGHLQEEAFPANYPEVLKIAATDYRGRETAESLQNKADFMLPGDNIVAKTTFLGSDNPTDEVSGTSVATAIASGVASLVLACHRLSLSKQQSPELWRTHNKLKRELVRKVFRQMAADNTGNFVKPWLFFGGSEDQNSWGEARSTLDWLLKTHFPI
ncbi:peptidase S8/S53 domain-containing protein [Nemania abortiva]|nr:peptidase S8/S53 domain-containing protein [Nemania abortiva]